MKAGEEIYRSPFVITVCSGKGGVGKSFIAANIANLLADKCLAVLLWDADMHFPNQHLLVGAEPPVRLSDVYTGEMNVLQAIFKTTDNMHLLADTPATGKIREYSAEAILNVYKQLLIETEYDVIIIDTPALTNDEVLQCCNIADLITIVVNDEPTSLLDAYGLLKILLPYIGKEFINLLVNNVIDVEDADEISEKLNLATEKFLNTQLDVIGFIPYDRAVRQSIVQQKLFTDFVKGSEVNKALNKIVENILKQKNS